MAARPAHAGRALPTLCAFGQRLERGHLGRSARKVGGACQGFFRPGGARAVAAPVRARKTRFKPIGWASASGSGAQWTARPTDSLRFYCEGLEEKFLERGAPAPLSVRLKG